MRLIVILQFQFTNVTARKDHGAAPIICYQRDFGCHPALNTNGPEIGDDVQMWINEHEQIKAHVIARCYELDTGNVTIKAHLTLPQEIITDPMIDPELWEAIPVTYPRYQEVHS